MLLSLGQMVGCAEPMELYGFDVDWGNIPSSFGEDPFNVGPGGDGDTQHKVQQRVFLFVGPLTSPPGADCC
jgi:hypothetical protein